MEALKTAQEKLLPIVGEAGRRLSSAGSVAYEKASAAGSAAAAAAAPLIAKLPASESVLAAAEKHVDSLVERAASFSEQAADWWAGDEQNPDGAAGASGAAGDNAEKKEGGELEKEQLDAAAAAAGTAKKPADDAGAGQVQQPAGASDAAGDAASDAPGAPAASATAAEPAPVAAAPAVDEDDVAAPFLTDDAKTEGEAAADSTLGAAAASLAVTLPHALILTASVNAAKDVESKTRSLEATFVAKKVHCAVGGRMSEHACHRSSQLASSAVRSGRYGCTAGRVANLPGGCLVRWFVAHAVSNCRRSLMYVSCLHQVRFESLDGSTEANHARRDELFQISGNRGAYPQVFLVHGSLVTYVGDNAKVDALLDATDADGSAAATFDGVFLDAFE